MLATELLNDWLGKNPGARIRLLGVSGSNLAPNEQPDFFASELTMSAFMIDETVDEIREKFGSLSVGRAKILNR